MIEGCGSPATFGALTSPRLAARIGRPQRGFFPELSEPTDVLPQGDFASRTSPATM